MPAVRKPPAEADSLLTLYGSIVLPRRTRSCRIRDLVDGYPRRGLKGPNGEEGKIEYYVWENERRYPRMGVVPEESPIRGTSISVEFYQRFMDKVEGPMDPSLIQAHVLSEDAVDYSIQALLGDRRVTPVCRSIELLLLQGRGEKEGLYDTSGKSTILYMRDVGGIERVVEIGWDTTLNKSTKRQHGWQVRDYLVGQFSHKKGCRVISCGSASRLWKK